MKYAALLIYLGVGLAFLTATMGISSTQKQIGRYFQLPAYMGSVPDHIREAVLEGVPAGSSRGEVKNFLNARNIGRDSNTACESGDHLLTCTIGLRSAFWKLVRETCTVTFRFDPSEQLQDVKVRSQYFGVWERMDRAGVHDPGTPREASRGDDKT